MKTVLKVKKMFSKIVDYPTQQDFSPVSPDFSFQPENNTKYGKPRHVNVHKASKLAEMIAGLNSEKCPSQESGCVKS